MQTNNLQQAVLAVSEQAASELAVFEPAVSGPAVSGLAVSGPAVSGPAVSEPAVSELAVSELAALFPAGRVLPYQARKVLLLPAGFRLVWRVLLFQEWRSLLFLDRFVQFSPAIPGLPQKRFLLW